MISPVLTPATALTALQGLNTVGDVAKLLGTSRRRLLHHLYWRPSAYHQFTIPKRNGEKRVISAPPPVRKIWQGVLARYLILACPAKASAHGFVLRRSVVTNAEYHRGARVVLNLDLKEYFPSINFGRVLGALQSHPFKMGRAAAVVLAQLCCHKGCLPQGAATSPTLSNLVTRSLDIELSRLARSLGCRYSRYADDLTFSTRSREIPAPLLQAFSPGKPVLGAALVTTITSQGFEINDSKTRVMGRGVRQIVSGVKINAKLNVHWSYVRELRSTLYRWRRYGEAPTEAIVQVRRGAAVNLRRHVAGKLAYLAMVRGKDDPVYVKLAVCFARLVGRTVAVTGRAAQEQALLCGCLRVVAGLDSQGYVVRNGTAFHVKGVGLVTCYHVLHGSQPAEAPVVRWVLIDSANPSVQTTFAIAKESEHLDLAILTPATALTSALVMAPTNTVANGTNVILVGFPNWRIGDGPRWERGAVTDSRVISARRLIQFGCTVLAGNSGGPVLNSAGEVVGVAVYGAEGVFPNSAVRADHVRDLAK
jgi:retron-type reverse transcriptase